MMKNIQVINNSVCEQCKIKSCCFTDSTVKEMTIKLASETTVCPVSLLIESPLDIIDEHTRQIKEPSCIECNLCALSCRFDNMQIIEKGAFSAAFDGLNEKQYNAIANAYLHHIFDFAANTNRNKAISFNGFCVTHNGEEAFVEVDYGNDSLECVRRILADIAIYRPNSNKVINGIVVLKDIPRQGTHDVVNLIQKMSVFPMTADIRIYFTTFAILKYLASNVLDKQKSFEDLLYSIDSNLDDYLAKIQRAHIDFNNR